MVVVPLAHINLLPQVVRHRERCPWTRCLKKLLLHQQQMLPQLTPPLLGIRQYRYREKKLLPPMMRNESLWVMVVRALHPFQIRMRMSMGGRRRQKETVGLVNELKEW